MENNREAVKELICIRCPVGCRITVTEKDGRRTITGNTCNRGAEYAEKELTNPTRMVTTTVQVNNGALPVVSVRTREDIPKEKIPVCMKEIKEVVLEAPVRIGDIVIENVGDTGVAVIAAKNVERV